MSRREGELLEGQGQKRDYQSTFLRFLVFVSLLARRTLFLSTRFSRLVGLTGMFGGQIGALGRVGWAACLPTGLALPGICLGGARNRDVLAHIYTGGTLA